MDYVSTVEKVFLYLLNSNMRIFPNMRSFPSPQNPNNTCSRIDSEGLNIACSLLMSEYSSLLADMWRLHPEEVGLDNFLVTLWLRPFP